LLASVKHAQQAGSKNYMNGAPYSNKLVARQVKSFFCRPSTKEKFSQHALKKTRT